MPPQRTEKPKSTPTPTTAAQPIRKTFDPWNSSSTGHQHAANRLAGSTSWRSSRTLKLGEQFRSGSGVEDGEGGGGGGGKRLYDTVGAGSRDFGRDGRKENGGWERGAKGLRGEGQLSLAECFAIEGVGTVTKPGLKRTEKKDNPARPRMREDDEGYEERKDESEEYSEAMQTSQVVATIKPEPSSRKKQIFKNLSFYINGSTAPKISDHRLKYLLAEHGARVSIALGRRSVTHVIIGTPNGAPGSDIGGSGGGKGRGVSAGAGGGLAASKIQKEISRVGGCGVRVLESIKAQTRLPEAPFSTIKLAPKSQKSVYGMFKKSTSFTTAASSSFDNDIAKPNDLI
ncbi:MAG: hypothetical protein M1827_005618 [Pycnora praestabilis]|nr:MAG: hypothetical protein M1827_005618 [Pycnora praestabilis]